MCFKTRCNITHTVIIVFYSLLLAIMALGYFFPEPTLWQAPWYAWAVVGEVIAFMIATLITCLIARKKDKELKEQYE